MPAAHLFLYRVDLGIAPATHVSSSSQVLRRLNLYSATCIAKQRVCLRKSQIAK